MGSRPNEVNIFCSIYLIVPAALNPRACSASDRTKYQKQKNNVSSGSRALPVRRAVSLSAICEPVV
jgi:hypothetical protein